MDRELEIYNYKYLLRTWLETLDEPDRNAQTQTAIESEDLDTLRAAWEAAERDGAFQLKTALYCHLCSFNAPSKCLAYAPKAAPESCELRGLLYESNAA